MSPERPGPPSPALELPAGVKWLGELPLDAKVESCLLELDDSPFDLARFASADIALPPAIAGSVAKRQAEFFYGRFAARVALGKAGVVGFPVHIGRFREPLWPPDMAGSLTHCRGFAAAAVA